MKIVLGTVQFGMNYGITNKNRQTSEEEVEKILEFAKNHSISVLDTAQDMGIQKVF